MFALGAVIYEMATGRQAFDGESRASIIAAILEHDPPPLTAILADTGSQRPRTGGVVPPLLEHVVSRCLVKQPDARWQTAADVGQELKWIAEGSPALRASFADTVRSKSSSGRLGWIAAALALGIAAVLYVSPRFGSDSREPNSPSFTQLTFRRGNITRAQFAMDGQTILYSAAWDGAPIEVFETRPSGPESRSFAGLKSAGLESVSSLNELAVILGCRLDMGFCTGTLARMPLTGGAPREVLADVANADWTPDGREHRRDSADPG